MSFVFYFLSFRRVEVVAVPASKSFEILSILTLSLSLSNSSIVIYIVGLALSF